MSPLEARVRLIHDERFKSLDLIHWNYFCRILTIASYEKFPYHWIRFLGGGISSGALMD
jgi:hypothetical protein